ncbi:MAG TPA: hypothetical protein VF799_06000 [Geobacteraceae bacterium]
MITTSEAAVTITIWVLALAGAFFGGRAAWRRRRDKWSVEFKESALKEWRNSLTATRHVSSSRRPAQQLFAPSGHLLVDL